MGGGKQGFLQEVQLCNIILNELETERKRRKTKLVNM